MKVTTAHMLALLPILASARDVPQNLKDLIASITNNGTGVCQNQLASGFYAEDDSGANWSYCGDHLDSNGIIYIQGQNGDLVDMDTDCDGIANGKGSESGQCTWDDGGDSQDQTSYGYMASDWGNDDDDVNAMVHTYVVLGNTGSTDGYSNYNPKDNGIEPMSLVAVVCGENQDKLIYGVWADENGDDDGYKAMVGEASMSLATLCFGDSMNENSGWGENNVLYIAFKGEDAMPKDTANWNADTAADFEASLGDFGDKLVAAITV